MKPKFQNEIPLKAIKMKMSTTHYVKTLLSEMKKKCTIPTSFLLKMHS